MSRRIADGKKPSEVRANKKAGRKTKLKKVVKVTPQKIGSKSELVEIDKELLAGITSVLRIGGSAATAAALNGIHVDTMTSWVLKGKEDPSSLYGQFYIEVLKAIADCEFRALTTVDAYITGKPATYEMEVVKNKRGTIVKKDGEPLMQIARDPDGYPIIKTPAIVPDPKIALQLLERRFPKAWGLKSQVQITSEDPILDARPSSDGAIDVKAKKSFTDFCKAAGYPQPFPKQIEMMQFMINGEAIRMLLGARGYGKTDYGPAMGTAYAIYLDPDHDKTLIVSKSEEKNAAILKEIANALRANGVDLSIDRATAVRTLSCKGKDHSVSALTMGSASFRGKHPTRVLMDDPVTPEDSSPAVRKRAETVFSEVVKLQPNVCVIGQPVHKHDLYAHLRSTDIDILEVPFGQIPELDHDIEAQRLAGVSEDSIQASYFLKVPEEGIAPFDAVNYLDAYPQGQSPSVAFIDPSFKGGDFTALSIGKAHFEGFAVQGHVWKRAWNHCLEDMGKQMAALGVKKIFIETNSLGDQPVIMLRQLLKGSGIGVTGRDSTTNKHGRIMNAGAYAHLLHISRRSDKEYIKQVVQYEYGAEFDDAPDSLASLLHCVGLIRGTV